MHSAIIGAILGTAVGDALGLPYEGLSRRRGVRLYGEPDRHRFILGRGMVSDDTEHTCLVAQALIASGGNVERFPRDLAWRLRWWLLGLPAGIGRATLRAILKLWCGFSPEKSGVYSAGNGPAMRSAILGAAVDDPSRLRALIRSSSRITHSDPRAEHGALAVALAARLARDGKRVEGSAFLNELRMWLSDEQADEFLQRIERAVASARENESASAFADSLGLANGVSGYVYHTVPVAIQVWLRQQDDFAAGVQETIRCGGDTDSTAAIVGGIVGCALGKEGIPSAWLSGLCEWPRTIAWMEELGLCLERALAAGIAATPPRLSPVGLFARNLVFLILVLAHALRRCLPPY